MGCCRKIPARYWIMAMIFLTTYTHYTTQSNMSVSLPAMISGGKKKIIASCATDKQFVNDTANDTAQPQEDTGPKYDWDERVQGLILGAYFYGYIIGNLPGGGIAEWIGPFLTIFIAHGSAAILNSVCVFVTPIHWGALFGARFLIGLTGGAVYPALQCLIGRWAPPQEKTKFVACLMGNTLGTCLTWSIGGYVIKYYKWPLCFHVFSLQLLVYLIIFYIFTFDSPEQHKWITEGELTFIKTSQEGSVSRSKAMPPYKSMFKSIPFWALCILQFGNLWGLYVQISAVPKYMKEFIGFDIKDSGALSSLPHLSRLFLGLGYGFLGDWLRKRCRRVVILKSFLLLSHFIPGILMGVMGLAKCDATVTVVLLVLSMSINGAVVVTNLANPTDLAPNFAGSVFGIVFCLGSTTGFIVPSITGAILTSLGNTAEAWTYVFALGGVMYCTSGILFVIFGSAKLQPWNEKT